MKLKLVAVIALSTGCSFVLMSCIRVGQTHLREEYISDPFVKEQNPEGMQCAEYLVTISPNIVTARLKQIGDVRDSDVIGSLVCSTPSISNLTISYRASDRSWKSRHAMPRSSFVDLLQTSPNLYESLVYTAEALGITPYYIRTNGTWQVFLFDRISGEVGENFLPESARILPLRAGGRRGQS